MSNEEREEEEGKVTKKFKDENKMTLITTDTSFPVDDTPTPTKILRMANDLFPDFQDPKENPFDIHFRKAAEAVKSGTSLAFCIYLLARGPHVWPCKTVQIFLYTVVSQT